MRFRLSYTAKLRHPFEIPYTQACQPLDDNLFDFVRLYNPQGIKPVIVQPDLAQGVSILEGCEKNLLAGCREGRKPAKYRKC